MRLENINDNECLISVSLDDENGIRNNQIENKTDLSKIYNYNIDIWNGYQLLLDCQKSNKLSIICTGNIRAMRRANENIKKGLQNIENVYIFNNVSIKNGKLTRTNSNFDANLVYLCDKLFKITNFNLFSENDLMNNIALDDKSNIYHKLKLSLNTEVLPHYTMINYPLMLVYMLNKDLFKVTNYENHKIISYKESTHNKIKDIIYSTI